MFCVNKTLPLLFAWYLFSWLQRHAFIFLNLAIDVEREGRQVLTLVTWLCTFVFAMCRHILWRRAYVSIRAIESCLLLWTAQGLFKLSKSLSFSAALVPLFIILLNNFSHWWFFSRSGHNLIILMISFHTGDSWCPEGKTRFNESLKCFIRPKIVVC